MLSLRPSTIAAPVIQRHGPGDGVVALNVGRKKVQTLRSTLAQNKVLMEHVLRAKVNAGIMSSGDNTVFINRDPKHFGTILEYLRNTANGVYRNPSVAQRLMKLGNNSRQASGDNNCQAAKNVKAFIELSKDPTTLIKLHFKLLYYNITKLTEHIDSQQLSTRISDTLRAKYLPQMAPGTLAVGKKLLVVVGGIITGVSGWVCVQAVWGQA